MWKSLLSIWIFFVNQQKFKLQQEVLGLQFQNCKSEYFPDEVVLKHEIYLELYICFSCQESFIHFIFESTKYKVYWHRDARLLPCPFRP